MNYTLSLLSPEELASAAPTDTLAPFSFRIIEAGDLAVTAHPRFAQLAGEVAAALASRTDFSAVCDRLDTQLSTELLTMGYQIDRKSTLRGYILTDAKLSETPLKTAFSSPVDAQTVDNYQNLTTIPIKRKILEGALAYGYAENRELLALAVTHSAVTGREVEVTVETAPAHRRRGLARACLFGLTRELQMRGVRVIYRCREGNVASLATARSLGFVTHGRFYHSIGRRIR